MTIWTNESLHSRSRPLRIAVTGASGFVGMHLLDRLVREGVEVVALSRRGTGRADVDDRRVDYGDYAAIETALRGIDAVVHLAARAHELNETGEPEELVQRYCVANVDSTIALAKAASASGVPRLVFMSSIGVNGNSTRGKAFTLDDAPNPVEPYAQSKWIAEREIAAILGTGGTDFVILRPPLVYGPRCRGNFERLLRMAARAPLLPLGGLHAPRTLISVANLTDAIVIATSDPRVSRRTFLVADARDTSVSEIMRTLVRGCGRSPHIVVNVPSSVLAMAARLASKRATWEKLAAPLQVDGSEFRRVTGWQPRIDPAVGLYETARQSVT